MQARTRIGLIVGVIGLVLNVCVSGFVGFCGPVFSLIAGGVAGFLAAQQEKPLTKNEGARVGATAGVIAGALIILGQILGGVAALFLMQSREHSFRSVRSHLRRVIRRHKWFSTVPVSERQCASALSALCLQPVQAPERDI